MPSKYSRRRFLQTSLSGAVAASWAPPPGAAEPMILDLHQHALYGGRSHEQLVAHQKFHDVTTTVLLPGEGWMLDRLGGNRSCAELQSQHPDRFVRFACADAAESRAVDVLWGNIERGAVGIGEMNVSCCSRFMLQSIHRRCIVSIRSPPCIALSPMPEDSVVFFMRMEPSFWD